MHAICGACPQMASLRGPGRSGRALTRHTYLYAGLITTKGTKNTKVKTNLIGVVCEPVG